MRVAIIGTELSNLICAHTLLDQHPEMELHLIEERPETGLMGEGPGLLNGHFEELFSREWHHHLGSQQPNPESSALRRSWLEKSIASKLSERGAVIHLRTHPTIDSEGGKTSLFLTGAGLTSERELVVDHLLSTTPETESNTWFGGVHNGNLKASSYEGSRSDGLVEVWWSEEENNQYEGRKWLQIMEWRGADPRTALVDAISRGRALAATIL